MSDLDFDRDVDFVAFFNKGQRVPNGNLQFASYFPWYSNLVSRGYLACTDYLGHTPTKIEKIGKTYKSILT